MNLLLLAAQTIEGRRHRAGDYVLGVDFQEGCLLIQRGRAICATPGPQAPIRRKPGRPRRQRAFLTSDL
jgi:hypothetical protein